MLGNVIKNSQSQATNFVGRDLGPKLRAGISKGPMGGILRKLAWLRFSYGSGPLAVWWGRVVNLGEGEWQFL